MSTNEKKAIVRRYYKEYSKTKDMSVVKELVSDDFVNHSAPPGVSNDKQGVIQMLQMYEQAFPDHLVTIEDMVAEEDHVAVRWTVRGTHEAELMGIPASGNEVETEGISVLRVVDGQITEQRENIDMMSLMQQIGAVSDGSPAA